MQQYALWFTMNGIRTNLWNTGTLQEMQEEKNKLTEEKPQRELAIKTI